AHAVSPQALLAVAQGRVDETNFSHRLTYSVKAVALNSPAGFWNRRASSKMWKDFFRHHFQGPPHVGHGETAEVDHTDDVGNADLFVFSKDLFCPFGIRKDTEFFFSHVVQIWNFGSGAPRCFQIVDDAGKVRTG